MLPSWLNNKTVLGLALLAGLGTAGYLLTRRERPSESRESEKLEPVEMEAPAFDNIPEPDDFAGDEIPTVSFGPLPSTPPSGPPIEQVVVPTLDFLE